MIKKKYYTKAKQLFREFFILFFTIIISCDLKNPASFKMPTWFFDLMFPLVQQRYSLEGMVDNKQIFSTPDSLGIQLMFEGVLPDTSIGSDILEITLDTSIPFSLNPTSSPTITQSINVPFDTTIDIIPSKTLINSSGATFSIPPTTDQHITQATWNSIASAFNPSIHIPINIPSISLDQFDFIESINGVLLKL